MENRSVSVRSMESLSEAAATATSPPPRECQRLMGSALLAVARCWLEGGSEPLDQALARVGRSFAFAAERRRSGGIAEAGDRRVFVVKGAFEALLPLLVDAAGTMANADATTPADRLAAAERVMAGLAAAGLRVIAVAWRELTPAEEAPAGDEADLFEHDLVHERNAALPRHQQHALVHCVCHQRDGPHAPCGR